MGNLPKAPQNEGVDPLTKGKKYQDGENLKKNSTLNDEPTQAEIEATERSEQTLADQEARNAEANTPTEPESTPDVEPEVEVTGNNEDGSVEANVDGEPTTLTPADEETQTAVEEESEVADTAEAEQPTE